MEDALSYEREFAHITLARVLMARSHREHAGRITNHFALPLPLERPGGLVVEMTDGTATYNASHYRVSQTSTARSLMPGGM